MGGEEGAEKVEWITNKKKVYNKSSIFFNINTNN